MSTIKLAHYDDGKQKYQSHEISIYTKNCEYCEKTGTYGYYSIENITGYGNSKEEAYRDFENKINYAIDQLNILKQMLNDTDLLYNDTISVDCIGNKID